MKLLKERTTDVGLKGMIGWLVIWRVSCLCHPVSHNLFQPSCIFGYMKLLGIWKKLLSWYGCFQIWVVPQNGWCIMENPIIKLDDLGGPALFLETPICGSLTQHPSIRSIKINCWDCHHRVSTPTALPFFSGDRQGCTPGPTYPCGKSRIEALYSGYPWVIIPKSP